VAQQEGATILKRVPQIDFVLGTRAIGRLPGIVERVEAEREPVVDVEMTTILEDIDLTPAAENEERAVTAFVTIMRGCDNYCTYCVVPYVRGREVSRSPDRIVDEVRALVESGVREVTLLGQNVNSYGQKEGLGAFDELLSRINDIDGLWRIRFTTSHPKDLSDDLIRCFGDLEKLCHHIHLPVQSGSNRMLKRMNRHYTREQYLEQIVQLRSYCPDIAVTSDIIVGFPGETRADFDQTLDLIKDIEYDSLFMFVYSDRPLAPAARFSGKISEEEKKGRFQELLSLQNQMTIRRHEAQVGQTVPVLVEGLSKKQKDVPEWTGRASTNRVVNFSQESDTALEDDLRGKIVRVKIRRAFPHSLWGSQL
jgi:tRNA-2-methylthio-N6-dimethylallyladenosine synthase